MSHVARYEGAGKRRAPRRRPWVRRHWVATAMLAVLLVPALGGAAYAIVLNSQFGNLGRVSATSGLSDAERPDPAPGEALNILLLGTDKAEGADSDDATIAQDAAGGEWPSGRYRSDTLMVAHVSADREDVTLVSVPRDSYVDIYDADGRPQGKDKVNAAFAYYGPGGAIATVEHLTDLRMDHLAMIDWDGFKDLSTALGGVRVKIPETSYDSAQDITWKKGWTTLKGKRALQYVRTRHGLPNGDFDRIARQQNFVRALMEKLLSSDTVTSPTRLTAALGAVTRNLTVDDAFGNDDIRGLAFAMRGVRTDDVGFLTTPTSGFATADNGASVVTLDEVKDEDLFAALRADDVAAYLAQYPEDNLERTVS